MAEKVIKRGFIILLVFGVVLAVRLLSSNDSVVAFSANIMFITLFLGWCFFLVDSFAPFSEYRGKIPSKMRLVNVVYILIFILSYSTLQRSDWGGLTLVFLLYAVYAFLHTMLAAAHTLGSLTIEREKLSKELALCCVIFFPVGIILFSQKLKKIEVRS